jgi:hypothetical protein
MNFTCNLPLLHCHASHIQQTLTRNGVPVIASEYSCCKCAGGGEFCPNVIYGDAATKSCPGGLGGISTSPASGPFTVHFTPVDFCAVSTG